MPLSYVLGKLIKHMSLVCLVLAVLCHCCHSDKSPYIFLLVLPFFPLGGYGVLEGGPCGQTGFAQAQQ